MFIICMAKDKDIEWSFKTHYRTMYKLAVMLLHDDVVAKDIVHDVFAHLLDHKDNVTLTESYLMTCVRNRCLNEIRAKEVQDQVKNGYLMDFRLYGYESNHELEQKIIQLQAGLYLVKPPECLEVLLLHFYEKLTFREIAERQQISETAVYKRLRNALGQLRTLIDRKNG